MTLPLVYTAAAEQDLVDILDYLTDKADRAVASRFVGKLAALCDGFAVSPARGPRRDDIAPGVRSYGWRRRATIIFRATTDKVLIVGVCYGGRDFAAALAGRDFDA